MPDEEGFHIARAWVSVSPDADGFREELESQLKAQGTGDGVNVPVRADPAELNATLDEVQARLGELRDPHEVGLSDEEAGAVLDDLKLKIDDVADKARLPHDFTLSDDDADAKLDALLGYIAAVREEIGKPQEVKLETDDAEAKLAGLQASEDEAGKSADSAGGFMQILAVAAAALGPELIVAGSGAVAFAALAVPSIEQVVKASSDMSATWDKVPDAQRTAEVGIRSLVGDYKSLATSVKPEVLADFNIALSDAGEALDEVAPVARAAGVAFGGLFSQFGAFLASSQTQQFGHFLADQIGPDLHSLGNALQGTVTGIEGLTEGLNPLSKAVFNVAGGILSFVGDLARVNPALTSTVVAVAAGAYAWAKLAGAVSFLPDLTAIGTGLRDAATAAAGMGVAFSVVAAEEGVLAASTAALEGAFVALEAVNPLVWAIAGAAAVGGLTYALLQATPTMDGYIASQRKAADASGWNIAGYHKLAGSLNDYSAATMKAAYATTDGAAVARFGSEAYASALGQVNQAQQQAVQQGNSLQTFLVTLASRFDITTAQAQQLAIAAGVTARQVSAGGSSYQDAMIKATAYGDANEAAAGQTANLRGALAAIEGQFGLTKTQALQLASAAGVTAGQLSGSGAAANKAMEKIDAYAQANLHAGGPVKQLQTDMSEFSNAALNAQTRITGLDDAYDTLVGNFVSSQQAQLQVQQDLLTLAQNAQQAGASMTGANAASTTLQQSFFATIPDIENTANAMVKQGDSTKQVTAYIDDQTDKLAKWAGKNSDAQQAVQGLREWEDNLKASTDQAGDSFAQAGETLQQKLISQVESAGVQSGVARGAVDKLATSIYNTGTQSSDTAGARAQLIKDLEKAGVNAATARTDVQNLITTLGKIPKSETTHIIVTGSGTWSVQESTGTAQLQGAQGHIIRGGSTPKAHGGLLRGGIPGKDTIPILAQQDETVLSVAHTQQLAPVLKAIGVPGFAAGGFIGSPQGLGTWAGSEEASTGQAVDKATVRAIESAMSSAVAGASAGGPGFTGSLGGSVAGWIEAAMKIDGVPQSWLSPMEILVSKESGGNPRAYNPSGASGLGQMKPGTFADYTLGGSIWNPVDNMVASMRYIKAIYGSPFGIPGLLSGNYVGYDAGGIMEPVSASLPIPVNTTGQPEAVLDPDETRWLKQAATAGAAAGGSSRPINVTFQYYGTQHPTPEQQAEQRRDAALAFGHL